MCIRSETGNMIMVPVAIMHRFVEYFLTLCSPIPPYDRRELTDLLSGLPIPALEADNRA